MGHGPGKKMPGLKRLWVKNIDTGHVTQAQPRHEMNPKFIVITEKEARAIQKAQDDENQARTNDHTRRPATSV